MLKANLLGVLAGVAGVAALSTGGALAHQQTTESGEAAHSNGSGYDPDGDSNPAVNTRLIARIGDAAEAALDPPFKIITFETSAPHADDMIHTQKIDNHTVTFSPGVKRQVCDGQPYSRYDSACVYMAAPSGRYAAVYSDEFHRPLSIEFDKPVCAAALAVYPTGGAEGETFKVVLQPYSEDGAALDKVEYEFNWTKDTFRWRLMAGAFFLDQKAKRVDVNVESKANHSKIVRFLIDDVAFIEDDCSVAMDDINAEGGLVRTTAPAQTSEPAAPAEPADAAAPAEPAAPADDAGQPTDLIPETDEVEGS